MNGNVDRYIESCLKNWVAKHRPPAEGKHELLEKAGYPPLDNPAPFTRFFSAFANRWSSPGEQFYAQRHWQLAAPFSQSMTSSYQLAINLRLAH